MNRHAFANGKLRSVRGWHPSPRDPRDMVLASPGLLTKWSMPQRSAVATKALRVEDQEWLGSCTCNAGTSMHEYVEWRQSKGERLPQLSRLWLYARVRKLWGVPLTEDSGAFNRDVMKALTKWGCPDESRYPYDLSRWSEDPPSELDIHAAEHKANFYYRCPNLWAVKASISQGFPVLFGFSVPRSMFSIQTSHTGDIQEPGRGETFDGGHAVLAIGYDDAMRRVRFLNSWGTGWGSDGYGTIPYSYFEKGLADDAYTLRSVLL